MHTFLTQKQVCWTHFSICLCVVRMWRKLLCGTYLWVGWKVERVNCVNWLVSKHCINGLQLTGLRWSFNLRFIDVLQLVVVHGSSGDPLFTFDQVMEASGVFNLVFSSSATVYGTPQFLPLTEKHPVGGCTNPYGKTKFTIEQMLNDLASSNKVSRCSGTYRCWDVWPVSFRGISSSCLFWGSFFKNITCFFAFCFSSDDTSVS